MFSKIITKAKKKMEEMEPIEKPSEYAMEVMKPKGKGESKKEDMLELEMLVKSAKKKKS